MTVRPGTGAQPVTTTKEVTLTREQLRAFLERGIFSFGGSDDYRRRRAARHRQGDTGHDYGRRELGDGAGRMRTPSGYPVSFRSAAARRGLAAFTILLASVPAVAQLLPASARTLGLGWQRHRRCQRLRRDQRQPGGARHAGVRVQSDVRARARARGATVRSRWRTGRTTKESW